MPKLAAAPNFGAAADFGPPPATISSRFLARAEAAELGTLGALDNRKIEIDRFEQVLAVLQREFPDIRVEVQREHPHLEAAADIPVQRGVSIPVSINLQNADELHLNIGEHFWVEWFPCGQEEVFERYCAALRGWLSGRYQVVESYVGGKAVAARLQEPVAGGWENVASWGSVGGCLPLPRRKRFIKNMGT